MGTSRVRDPQPPDSDQARSLRAPVGSAWILGFAVLVAAFWLAIEFACILISHSVFGAAETAARAIRYAPWQIALFVAASLPVIPVTRRLLLSKVQAGWLVLYSAWLALLGTHLLMGVFRHHDLGAWNSRP